MTAETPALPAAEAPARTKPSNYPEPFAALMAGRIKRPLGDLFGLKTFGVNLTRLAPGSLSALHHSHSHQDEFIYVLEGTPVLVTGETETQLAPGMVAGFPAGGAAHHIENRSATDCVILEIGDRTAGDEVTYPADDLATVATPDGRRVFVHKDGTPY